MAERERLYLFDTTLRDGAQTQGINFSLNEKIAVTALLEELGVDYIEGGWPGANATDSAFFQENRTEKALFTAFGMTKKAGRSLSNDPGLSEVIQSAARAICLVGKTWDFHVRVALGVSLEENLDAIAESMAAIKAASKEALFDCEHFFDGFKANPTYAATCAKKAFEAGARWVVLCDTNGGTMPEEIFAITTEVTKHIPGDHLGIHAHDDTGQAVANSLAAVRAGARQIQGTLNGLGERCGNANLVSLIPTLMTKAPFSDQFTLGTSEASLARITTVSRQFDAIINQNPSSAAPYVGTRAFAHKGGLHASAIAKDASTYEHVEPESVGNTRRLLVSNQAGRSNLLAALDDLGIEVDKNDPRLSELLEQVKEREAIGYVYEDATASFELLARRTLGIIPTFFTVDSFRVGIERRINAVGEMVTVTEAVVKVAIGDQVFHSVAEGNGPIDALDAALRKDLGIYQTEIDDIEVIDFKVRILDGSTKAVTRVLIVCRDREGNIWRTVGVSPNIVDASFEALHDSFTLKLLRAGNH